MMREVLFLVEELPEGGYLARCEDGCIFTEADSLEELRREVRDAACCHCEPETRVSVIRLRFLSSGREELLAR
jgi:hypothetical protein